MLAVALVAANAFLSAFAGTWSCAASTWTIAAAPERSWAIARWRGPHASGTAYVGYLAVDQQWILEEFRSDGTFATGTSSGPQNGTWTWSSTITTPQRVQHGAMQWRRDGAVLRQRFGRLLGPSFLESSHTACRPAAPP
jgi:hypothetical protein